MTTGDVLGLMRGARAWAALAVPLAGAMWMMHEGVQAQAVQLGNLETRMAQIEAMMSKLDKIADDVSAIRVAQAAEKGWRRGLLQSLPGAEGE